MMTALIRSTLLVAPFLVQARATGKGPIGIYAISDRFVLVADSNFDALIAVDVLRGGKVGALILHGRDLDPPDDDDSAKRFVGGTDKSVMRGWMDPTGVASCDACRFIYVSSTDGNHFYQIELPSSLRAMALSRNFAGLANATVTPVWPWDENITGVGKPTSSVRMIEVPRDGRVGFLAHRDYGILRFFLDGTGRITGGDVFMSRGDLGDPSGVVAGLTLTENGRELLVTASRSTLIVGVDADGGGGTLRGVVDLQGLCNGGTDRNMWFRDAVLVRNATAMYVVGLFTPGQNGNGMAIYRLRRGSGEEWGHCEAVAGPPMGRGGWRDGLGDEARFTRPHEFTLLPRGDEGRNRSGEDILVVGDADNRAVRLVELTSEPSHHVSTVSYDEGLWWTIYNEGSIKGGSDRQYASRTPFLSPQAEDIVSNATFIDAEWECRSAAKGAGLCSLADLREAPLHEIIRSPSPVAAAVAVWTSASCYSCWLHFPGVCGNESGGWDSDYRMLALLSPSSGRIKTECTHEEKNVVVTPICCAVSDAADTR